MQRILLLFIVFLTALSIGCGQSQMVKDSWKFTTRQYKNYLNRPASLNLDDKGDCELYELALGEAVMYVDTELQKLTRAMENSDHNPDQYWVMNMMGRFPWLSGVALVDGRGGIIAQYPQEQPAGFDISALLEPDPKQRMGALRAQILKSDSQAMVYLANPVFGGEALRGLIIAYFDPRSLVTLSYDPSSFAMASPVGLLWPGSFGESSVLASENWDQLLKSKSCGILGSGAGQFFWTTRYLGNLPLVYAMPTSAGVVDIPTPPAPPEAREKSSEVVDVETPKPEQPAVKQDADVPTETVSP